MRWPLTCFLVLYSLGCFSQQYYETYTPANGLLDARVTRILQDGSGRIFFLTKDGISIYDGQRFINHTKIDGRSIGIVNDGILLPDGSLLLACFSGNWVHCTRDRIFFDTTFVKNIPEISEILSLPGDEKLIVSNIGLFDLKNGRLTDIQLPLSPIKGTRWNVEKVAVSGDNVVFNFYMDNRQMVYIYNKNTAIITDSLAIPTLYEITADPEGRIQLSTGKGIIQLNKDELKKGMIKTESPWFSDIIPANIRPVAVFFDHQKNIWFIDWTKGCTRVDPFTHTTSNYFNNNGLLPAVRSICQDKENNYWFIAPGKGVQKLVQTTYEAVNKIGNNIFSQVYSSASTDDSSLFLFADAKMMVLKNGITKELSRSVVSTEPNFYWQKTLWTFQSPTMLAGNNNQGIVLGDQNSMANKLHYPSFFSGIDNEGNLILSGNHIIVVKKDRKAYMRPLPYFADNIVTDDKNNYWAFCRSDDFVKFSFVNNELVRKVSLKHDNIGPRYAINWNKDTFWIATRENGILVAKMTDESVNVIGRIIRQDGLSNDFVETLLKIDEHRVAAGTASGLDIITLSGTDTLIENISSRINHFEPVMQLGRDEKGIIYARTENLQLFRYDPFITTTSGYIPEAWFSRIKVNDELIDPASHTFNYLKNSFSFAVSSPSFNDNRNINFRFSLKGEKREWQQNSNNPDFGISNLLPGNYILTVLVKYPGRIYADKKLEYRFTIRLPFWKTWWFIGLLLLIIFLSAWYLVRGYLKRQLEKQKQIMEKELAIEQERTRVARELHDGLGSMLSGVKHSFAAMKNELKLGEADEAKFHSNIDKLNESIKELRNITHSMASDSLLKFGLENSLRDHCRNISQSGQLAISFETLATDKMLLKEDQVFHTFRIVQELLQNIIKHSGAAHAIIQLSYNQRRLYITVEDDGKGFKLDDAAMKSGLGLKNIESRVKILNGKLDYQTAPSKGTSVFIEIPCEEKH